MQSQAEFRFIATKNPKKQGARRMNELGYRPIQAWVTPIEHAALKSAAQRMRKSLARFVIEASLLVANGLPLS